MERKITLEESVIYKEDYQMRILSQNQIEGILSVKGRGMNQNSYFDYDVSGKISVKAMYERSKISSKDIKIFLSNIREVLHQVKEHLLNIHCILLRPEYLFYENDKYYFCYYPLSESDFWDEFHLLTEYFVKQADYEDKEAVRMVFLLHKETMEENYSLDHIIEKCLEYKEIYPEEIDEIRPPKIRYDTLEHDWIKEQELGSSIMRETDNMWLPVKKFLSKHKKPKWGEWDGLYVEEEDL